MSSPMNNNMIAQGAQVPSSSSAPERRATPSGSSSGAANGPQRTQQSGRAHLAQNPQRGRPARSGRSHRGRPYVTPYNDRQNHLLDAGPSAEGSQNSPPIDSNERVQDQGRSDTPSSRARASNRGNRSSNKSTGGKYRQRQQTNQLINGLSGLDLDLVESIAPSASNVMSVDAGSRSRHSTNTRKVNLTHLLNYNYERKQTGRRRNGPSFSDANSIGSGNNTRVKHSYRDFNSVHKFNKQQFLQANCQFVVLDGYDCMIHKVDPDWPVDWDHIEEVKFRQTASTETTCPICLEPPLAAKITRCGHIYCWPCILHYLSLSDENNRQCPICFEPVYGSDLRSVVSKSYASHVVDEEIAMRLMVRKKGCVDVEPFDRPAEIYGPITMVNDDHLCKTDISSDPELYCSQANLVIVDPQTVISRIAQREKDELLLKMELDRGEPEVCFIEQALERLNRRISKLYQSASDEFRKTNLFKRPLAEQTISSNPADSKTYLFYQCSDGQHIYLNPFSTKILCHEFGSLENCPTVIKAKILQMDWVSMSEAWRKRFKYLEHLPLTCEFRLIEIDFEKSHLVSQQTFQTFEQQITMRAKERDRRRREERKREKIIQVEQNRKIYGIQPSLKINLNNIEQFPSVSDERYLGLSKTKPVVRDQDGTSDVESSSEDEQHLPSVITNVNDFAPDPDNYVGSAIEEVENSTPLVRSFRDIQLEEAANQVRPADDIGQAKQSSVWSGKGNNSSNLQQSSFAKLLLDAKSSQKEWTRNPAPSSSARIVVNQRPVPNERSEAMDSEDGEENLRAPPSEFTISDFIDTNVVSGKRKSGKPRTVVRKQQS